MLRDSEDPRDHVDQQGRDANHNAGHRQAVAFFACLLDLVEAIAPNTMPTIEPMQQSTPTSAEISETSAMVFMPGCDGP